MQVRVEIEDLKDGKDIQKLVQEWIDENSNLLYRVFQEKNKNSNPNK